VLLHRRCAVELCWVCCLASSTPTPQQGSCWWESEQAAAPAAGDLRGMYSRQLLLRRLMLSTQDILWGGDCDYKAVHKCCLSPSSTVHRSHQSITHSPLRQFAFLVQAGTACSSNLMTLLPGSSDSWISGSWLPLQPAACLGNLSPWCWQAT
jgi:hypothetical protein